MLKSTIPGTSRQTAMASAIRATTYIVSGLLVFVLKLGSGFSPRCCQLRHDSPRLEALPSLVVFDLDNTLWTPELYQLRKHQRNDVVPIAGRDVELFKGAETLLKSIQEYPQVHDKWSNTEFAVASRTKSGPWAVDLLHQFALYDFFDYKEIYPGDKQRHFRALREKSGIPFRNMIFFDDSRDGKYGNCIPVSELGVLCVHCPGGIYDESVFHSGIQKFGEWNGLPNAIVEWDGSLTQ